MLGLRRLRHLYTQYPVISNVVVYGTLYSTGDLGRQSVISSQKHYDLVSAKNMGIIGGGMFGPVYYFWYRFLDGRLPGVTRPIIVRKILMDQLIAAPILIFAFYAASSILEKKEKIFDEAVEKGPKTYVTGCCYWPCIQAINFALVPSQFRALYVGVAAFFWTTILSYIKSLTPKEELPAHHGN